MTRATKITTAGTRNTQGTDPDGAPGLRVVPLRRAVDMVTFDGSGWGGTDAGPAWRWAPHPLISVGAFGVRLVHLGEQLLHGVLVREETLG